MPELAVVFSRRPNESCPASNYDDASIRRESENVKEDFPGFGAVLTDRVASTLIRSIGYQVERPATG